MHDLMMPSLLLAPYLAQHGSRCAVRRAGVRRALTGGAGEGAGRGRHVQDGRPAIIIGAYSEPLELFRQQGLAGVLHRILVRRRRAEPRAGAADAVRTGPPHRYS